MPATTVSTSASQRIPGPLRRLIRRHEELEAMIAARHSHGLSAKQAFLVMVAIEDRICQDYPRRSAALMATWALARPATAHKPGQHNPACPLCAPKPLPATKAQHPHTSRSRATLTPLTR